MDDPTPMERLPHALDSVEVRVLGALLEKEQTTPDQYPLTVNALLQACNQKSNRDPVMALTEGEVRDALERLFRHVLVWKTDGARVVRWRHSVDRRWRLEPATRAVITVLLLRGPQTPGELRGRSERMHSFASVGEVEATLQELATGREPLVAQLAKAPGQKESRWRHLVGDDQAAPELASPTVDSPAPAAASTTADDRYAALERRIEALERAVRALEEALT
ncbi:MAG: YceH family protein [Acidobacteriota bacterium]